MASNNFQFTTPKTKAQKIAFFQNEIQPNYIAPNKNKDIDGMLNHDEQNSFYYGPDYIYGTDRIDEFYNIIDGGQTTHKAYSKIIAENTTFSADSTASSIKFIAGNENITIAPNILDNEISFSTNYYWDDINSQS